MQIASRSASGEGRLNWGPVGNDNDSGGGGDGGDDGDGGEGDDDDSEMMTMVMMVTIVTMMTMVMITYSYKRARSVGRSTDGGA